MSGPHASPVLPGDAPTRARFVLSGWLAGSAAIAYLCRQSLTVAEKTIRADLDLTEEQMGWIFGLFFWCYALLQIPGGRLGERFGSRLCLPLFSVVWSVATALSGMATGAGLLLLSRATAGLSQAGLFPCSAAAISRWNTLTERALASGFLAAAMQLGAVIAAPLTGVLMGVMSWRAVFVLYSVPGLIWAAGFYWWFRERIDDHPSANKAEVALVRQGRSDNPEASESGTAIPWGRMFASGALWLLCLQQFFRAAAYVWFASWFATYLQETRGVTRETSGWLTSLPLLTSLAATLWGGSLSDRVLRRTGSYLLARNGVAIVSLTICSLLVFAAYFIEDANWATVSIAAGAFFAASAGPCAYATSIDMGGRNVATVFGAMNMAGNIGAALLSTIVPHFRRLVDANSVALETFGGNSWNAVLVLFGSMYVLAILCWVPLRAQGSIFEDEEMPQESNHD